MSLTLPTEEDGLEEPKGLVVDGHTYSGGEMEILCLLAHHMPDAGPSWSPAVIFCVPYEVPDQARRWIDFWPRIQVLCSRPGLSVRNWS